MIEEDKKNNKSRLKAKFDYRFLAIWMALGNIIQFLVSIIWENNIKNRYDWRIWAILFIFMIPFLSYFFGKTKWALKREQRIKQNDDILNWWWNICFILVILFLVFSI